MAALNYATQYQTALANAYPHVLRFGALWNNSNASTYRFVDSKTIQIPLLTTKGRVDGNRESITGFTRNYDNDWETKTLSNHRQWKTLVHPKDVMETNMVTSIGNITQTYNETQKFPEMDAYTISKLYELKNAIEPVVQETADLTTANILAKFDVLMDEMDEALVPPNGRILYVDTYTKTLLDTAVTRTIQNADKTISRVTSRLDEVEIVAVPSVLMKTKYTFTEGWAVHATAKNIAMMLLHPSCVLPIASYSFVNLEAPSAHSEGKYLYFEESFEDIFILNKKHGGIKFVVKK